MRRRALSDYRVATYHNGMPLHLLPAHERQRVFAERNHSERCVLGVAGGNCDWRIARTDPPLFLRVLHELALHETGRDGFHRNRENIHAG